jgi:serine/threonine protein kinase
VADALVGRLLCGKWRIDRLLSSGGTSSVFSASHRNGRRAAIKVLRPELAADLRMKRRFLREGYLANRVGHAGAVSVLDDDTTDDGIVFLVMELLEGTNLERLCGEELRDPEEVAFMVDGLLDILGAAHASGIIHRDVKPSNVFLTTKGDIRLLDFGIARLREASSALSHTQNGAVLGTPGFMAPEQARGRWSELDARTDIWAVGATMFRLLTGRFVHDATTRQESMIAAATVPARPLRDTRADLPDSLAGLVDRALRFEVGERWPDAKEMQRALRAIRSELPRYVWQGISSADDLTDERTLDTSGATPTTSCLEESPPQTSGFARASVSRPGLVLALVGVVVAAAVPLARNLRARSDRPGEHVTADAVPGAAAVHGAASHDVKRGPETRVDTRGAEAPSTVTERAEIVSMRTSAGSTAAARESATSAASRRAQPAAARPAATLANLPAPPTTRQADLQVTSTPAAPLGLPPAPAPLEEFLDERQ